jgi:hypothetical protein
VGSNIPRAHSLAASDIIADESYEFVNPFDDESDILGGPFSNGGNHEFDRRNNHSNGERSLNGSTTSRHSFSWDAKFPRPGILRETSVSSTASSDLAGFGALFRGPDANNKSAVMTSDSILGNGGNNGAHIVPFRSNSIESRSTDGYSANNRYAMNDDIDEDDNRSVASESTLGLPLWDWFNRDDPTTPAVSHHPIPISLQ